MKYRYFLRDDVCRLYRVGPAGVLEQYIYSQQSGYMRWQRLGLLGSFPSSEFVAEIKFKGVNL
jgi:hypothetical protein